MIDKIDKDPTEFDLTLSEDFFDWRMESRVKFVAVPLEVAHQIASTGEAIKIIGSPGPGKTINLLDSYESGGNFVLRYEIVYNLKLLLL